MADVQVLAPGVKAAPLDYVIPGAQEILVKAITADFDGGGAGGAFIPAIQIIAPGSKLAGTFIANGQVAAGASASVSWAPFLAGAGPNGIQFDTYPQSGTFLHVTTTGSDPTTGEAMVLETLNNGAFDIETHGGGTINIATDSGGAILMTASGSGGMTISEDGGGLEINESGAGGLLIREHGGGITIAETNQGGITVSEDGAGINITENGDANITLLSARGVILASTHTGGGLVTLPLRINTGDLFAVEDSSNANAFMFTVSSNGIDGYLKTGKTFNLRDRNGNVILQVGEGGTTYRIKTGQAWVANL